ncbi:MAG: metallophosphoesterase [Candidatus Omnitrophica bacterium]|nr:metallophosphoesterase [Candidatus Omnitrophota bacterium]
MKILLIGDLHYRSDGISLIPERKTKYGIEFLKRIKQRVKENIDIVIICGDILDDGENPKSESEYIEIKKIFDSFEVKKILYVFGNHDKNPEKFYEIFGQENRYFVFDNFLFYTFCDRYFENDICVREKKEIENFKKFVKENRSKKIIVIQHNVVYPKLETTYPYNINEAEKIHNLYKENNVFLSISGHYHKGIDLIKKDNIYYFILPAICEEPFKFFILELTNQPKIIEENLKNSVELIDYHCHTEFGYCAEDVSMEKVIERCNLFGIKKVYFTEHAGQLYLSSDDYWDYKFFGGIDILKRQREEGKDRVKDYIEKFKSLNTDIAGLGVEVEVDKNGNLTLLPEDRKFFEILIGAVHYLPEEYLVSMNLLEKKFIWTIEKLVENKINILAHPFRFFVRKNIEKPKNLYRNVAKILKKGDVKVELNFHTNNPDPEFFRICIEENLEIVFGSDSHNLLEVGDFSKHIKFMKNLQY